MERSTFMKTIAFLISMILVFSMSIAAFAEEPAEETENAPEEAEAYNPFTKDIIAHRLWGFFTAAATKDTDWMVRICAREWRKGKEDPRQALAELLKSVNLRGYKVDSISGEDGDLIRTAGIILQTETGDGGYAYGRHEIVCRKEEDGYFFDPDGLQSGRPAEPVPEEELILMTPEEIMRNSMELHQKEGLYDRLIPINAGIEKQGIRVDVLSGLIEGKDAWFMVSLQDTEGKYDGSILSPSFTDNIDQTSYRRGWSKLYHDEAERKDTYLLWQELDREMTPEDEFAEVGIDLIRVEEEKTVDLLPLLKQYGERTEGAEPPKLEDQSYRKNNAALPEGFRVLDYSRPLDAVLFRDLYLTGIGWIGDQLHVQFHNRGRDFLKMRNGRGSACSVWVEASVTGKTYQETMPGYNPQDWDGDGDGWPEWRECIINCAPKEADQLEIEAGISITTSILEDSWQVRIGLDRIREESAN